MTKPTPNVRAVALSKLADACADTKPEAAKVLRQAAENLASGAAVLTGPLACSLRDAGLDAVSAQTACRIARG